MAEETTLDTEFETLIQTFGREEVLAYAKSLDVEETPDTEEDHSCEYMINSRDGGAKICGKKKAKNEHEGMWFCGTEKSGHFKSTLTASKKEVPKTKTAPAKGSEAKSKAVALVQKVVRKEKLNIHEVSPGSGIHADLEHFRIVFDKPTKEAIGVLDEDNETILPLTEDAINFLEVHSINFKQAVPVKTAKTAPPKASVKAPVSKPVAKAPVSKPVAKAPVAAAKPAVPVKAPVKAAPVKAPVKAPAAKTPVKAPVAKAPAAKAPVKTAPVKAPVKTAAAKAPVKTVATKAKVVAPTAEDEDTLDQLKQSVEDAVTEVDETEPNPEEAPEEVDDAENVEAEIDLGGEEEEPVVDEEVVEEDGEDGPDIEEVEEGEVAEEEEEEGENGDE